MRWPVDCSGGQLARHLHRLGEGKLSVNTSSGLIRLHNTLYRFFFFTTDEVRSSVQPDDLAFRGHFFFSDHFLHPEIQI
jgi:hypothetical protein